MSSSASADPPARRTRRAARGFAAPWRSRRGVAAVEFAVVGGLFMVMLLAAVEVGRYYMTVQGLRNFIADAGRHGMVTMQSGQTLCREQLVSAIGRGGVVGGLVSGSPGVCVSRVEAPVGGGGTAVTVTVTTDVTLNLVMNVFGVGPQRFQDTTTVRFVF
nr:TadE/TadG family type IV pilus assembly protein [Neoroseomonas alkaliterrae]